MPATPLKFLDWISIGAARASGSSQLQRCEIFPHQRGVRSQTLSDDLWTGSGSCAMQVAHRQCSMPSLPRPHLQHTCKQHGHRASRQGLAVTCCHHDQRHQGDLPSRRIIVLATAASWAVPVLRCHAVRLCTLKQRATPVQCAGRACFTGPLSLKLWSRQQGSSSRRHRISSSLKAASL